MTRLVNNAGLIALFLAVTSISLIALAAYTQPNAKGGCIALAADAGTLIPRTLVGSTSVTIQDNDINPISFGYTAAQAVTAGEVIAPGRTNDEEINLLTSEKVRAGLATIPPVTVTPTAPGDVNAKPVTAN